MYRDIPPQLLRAIEPVAHSYGFEVVDITLSGAGSRQRLVVVLDTRAGDGRVGVDDCAAVSREVGHVLDGLDLLSGSYTLEVSSPGVDRRLGREIDFERVIGRRVALETREPLAGRRRFRGELVAFDEGAAHLATERGTVVVPFDAIARAKALYSSPSPKQKR